MSPRDMDLDLLIKQVVAKVVERLEKQLNETTEEKLGSCIKKNRMLILIPDMVIGLKKYIQFIESYYSDYEITIGYTGYTQKVNELLSSMLVNEILNLDDKTSREKLMDTLCQFDSISLVSPAIKQMNSIASGNDQDFLEKIILYFVLHGKVASILLDYDIKNLPPSTLSRKMKELLETIESMGIAVCVLGEGCKSIRESAKKKRGLITENDIDEMWRKGIKEFRDDGGCIITPLARDRAKEIGLTIIG